MGTVLNYSQYGVPYLGSYYNAGPYINFPYFGNSNLGKPPCHLSLDWQIEWTKVDDELGIEMIWRGFPEDAGKCSCMV